LHRSGRADWAEGMGRENFFLFYRRRRRKEEGKGE
jgi:hypothetical protein